MSITNKTLEFSKTMSISRANFLKYLPLVFHNTKYKIKTDVISSGSQEKMLEIIMVEIKPLPLGAMALPQLQLQFKFSGYTRSDSREFMSHFWLVYRKGGG